MKQLVFFNSLLIVFLVFTPFLLPLGEAGDPLTTAGLCGEKCKVRCAKAGVQDRCLKYCQICCLDCKCVPSGTYGNKHECACYRNKKNSKGKPKCP